LRGRPGGLQTGLEPEVLRGLNRPRLAPKGGAPVDAPSDAFQLGFRHSLAHPGDPIRRPGHGVGTGLRPSPLLQTRPLRHHPTREERLPRRRWPAMSPSTPLGTGKRYKFSPETLAHPSNGLPKASGESSRQKAFPARRMVEAAGVEPASENRPIKASTCLACVFCLASKRPHRKGHLPASPLSLALLPRAGEEKPAHLYDAFPSPVSEERWAWLLVRQPVPAVGWQLCVSHLFYEEDGTSACRLY